MVQTFNSIYSEINKSNANHWAKFLFIILIIFGSLICMILYSTIFGRMNLLIKRLFIYGNLQFGSILLFIIQISSKVYTEANKSYALLN